MSAPVKLRVKQVHAQADRILQHTHDAIVDVANQTAVQLGKIKGGALDPGSITGGLFAPGAVGAAAIAAGSVGPAAIAAGEELVGFGTAFPGGPTAGQLFFRTDLGSLFVWTGARWIGIAPAMDRFAMTPNAARNYGAGANQVICDTVPVDTAGGVSAAVGQYTLPATPASQDWIFDFYMTIGTSANVGKEMFGFLRDHDNADASLAFTNVVWTSGVSRNEFMQGHIFLPNLAGGHRIQFLVSNGDTVNQQVSFGMAAVRFGGVRVA